MVIALKSSYRIIIIIMPNSHMSVLKLTLGIIIQHLSIQVQMVNVQPLKKGYGIFWSFLHVHTTPPDLSFVPVLKFSVSPNYIDTCLHVETRDSGITVRTPPCYEGLCLPGVGLGDPAGLEEALSSAQWRLHHPQERQFPRPEKDQQNGELFSRRDAQVLVSVVCRRRPPLTT